MKTFPCQTFLCLLIFAALLLTGCNKPAKSAPALWEYKIIKVTNTARQDHQKALDKWIQSSKGTTGREAWEDYAKTGDYAKREKSLAEYNETTDSAKRSAGELNFHETDLSTLGSEGWEMCGVITELETIEGETISKFYHNTRTGAATLIFKRRR